MSGQGRHFVGVDVGGTKILALVVTEGGEIVARHKAPTQTAGRPMADQIGAAIDGALAGAAITSAEVAGIGVAMPGSVDSVTGYLGTVPNVEIDDPRLVDRLRARYPVRVEMGNDVNLGTLAECWLGAGRGARTVVGMFVGTGIGGGVVIDGRLRTGPEDLAGEIGHMVLKVDGPRCGCGNLGCFEALASRTAIERDILRAIGEGRQSIVMEGATGGRIRSGALADALEAHDEVVTEVMTRAAHYLAQGALTIRHLLDPDMIIFGGGVIEACGDFLMPLIEAEVRADCMRGSRDVLRLAVSELADDAVALGAAALVEATLSGLPVYEMHGAQPAPPAPAPTQVPPDTGEGQAEPEPEPDPEAEAEDEDQTEYEAEEGAAGEDEAVAYPRIDEVAFGSVTVAGEVFRYDIHIRADGKLRRRKKRWARRDYGTSHVIGPRELKRLLRKRPEMLIIAQGFDSMVRLADEGRELLQERGVRWQMLPTPDAVAAWNQATGRKALVLHVTC